MYSTYCFFKQFRQENYSKMSLESLADAYTSTHDDKILAEAFVRLYGTSKSCLDRFYSLDEDTRTELVCEKLQKCLEKFRESKKTKFTTYYYAVLYRSAMDRIALETDKDGNPRDLSRACDSLERLQELGVDASVEVEMDIQEVLKDKHLRENERKFCDLVMKNAHKMTITEIADELGLSRPAIYSTIRRLKEVFKKEGEEWNS